MINLNNFYEEVLVKTFEFIIEKEDKMKIICFLQWEFRKNKKKTNTEWKVKRALIHSLAFSFREKNPDGMLADLRSRMAFLKMDKNTQEKILAGNY